MRLTEGEGHGDFGAHGVTDQDGRGDGLCADESFDIEGHSGVGVCGVVRGVAMVAEIEGVDRSG